jgi:thiol peroxidase
MERTGIIKMKGNPLTLVGNELKPGDMAPDFSVLDQDLKAKSLSDFAGKFKVISVTPSLDTATCDLQIHWFNEDAANQPKEVAVINISMDLPFAIRRFCATTGIDKAIALSDHREASFGVNWGVLIKELRLLARSIFIVDPANVIRYVQIVPEQSNEPDYEDAINFLKTLM